MATEFSLDFKNKYRTLLANNFNLDELQILAANLGVDFEEIKGSSKTIKVLELIEHMRRRGMLADLVQASVTFHSPSKVDWSVLGNEVKPFLKNTEVNSKDLDSTGVIKANKIIATNVVAGTQVIINTGGGAFTQGNATAGRDLIRRDEIASIMGGEGETELVPQSSKSPTLRNEPIKLYAAAPKQAEVGSAFRVAVQIRMPNSGPLEVAELDQVASADGQIFRSDEKNIVRYRVQIAATNCDVVGSSVFEFLLKQGQNSNLQNFMLQPHKEGEVLITVNAYQADTNILAASTFSQVKIVVVTKNTTLNRSQIPDDEMDIAPNVPLGGQDLVEFIKRDTQEQPNTLTTLTKILFAAANPTDTTRLRLGKEFDEIKAELERGGKRDKVVLALPQLATRGRDLSRALLQESPTIVHFSGHGEKNGAIYFETDNGNSNMVSAETLGALFEVFEGQVQCVILNACYSATQAQAIAKHIPYVIGMNRAIPDAHAIAFSIGFYQAIANGATIEKAYALGKVQIGLS